MDEQQLIERLKREEPGAFKELVEHYQDLVINTCHRFLFNREDAEDIAQEVFIEVHRSVGAFRQQSKISTWLYRIAVTKSIDCLRKKKRKKRFAPLKSLFILEEEGKEIPAPEESDPGYTAEQKERMDILKNAIDSLPENQKIAFTLSKCDGCGNKEISEIMGCTLSAVESYMHRAKQNLRKKLIDYFERDLKKKGTSFMTSYMIFLFIISFLIGPYAVHSFLCHSVGRSLLDNSINNPIDEKEEIQLLHSCVDWIHLELEPQEKNVVAINKKKPQVFSCFGVSGSDGDIREITMCVDHNLFSGWYCLFSRQDYGYRFPCGNHTLVGTCIEV